MEFMVKGDTEDLNAEQLNALHVLLGKKSGTDKVAIVVDLESDELDQIVQDMIQAAMEWEVGMEFRAPVLYRKARPGSLWNELGASDRKVLGRRFKQIVNSMNHQTEGARICVVGKTQQGSIRYVLKD